MLQKYQPLHAKQSVGLSSTEKIRKIREIRVRFLVFLVFARLCCKPEAVDKHGKEWLSLLKQGLPELRDICAACSTGEGFHGFCKG